MKTLKVFNSREEAEIVKSFLESAGIEVQIKADDLSGIQPGLAFTNGVKLLVDELDFEEAQTFLNSTDSDLK